MVLLLCPATPYTPVVTPSGVPLNSIFLNLTPISICSQCDGRRGVLCVNFILMCGFEYRR
jgi:hypothetical protein